MKLKHIFYTAAAMAMLSFQACTLDEDTSGISNPDDFFRKFSECQSVVNGCYIPIKSIYTYTYMIATECVTDIAYCPSGTLDASLDISPAVPRMGSTVWRNGYLGVQRCNFAVNGIERAYKNEVISEEQYHQLLCEAKTLRAFFYWTLTCFFGNVPSPRWPCGTSSGTWRWTRWSRSKRFTVRCRSTTTPRISCSGTRTPRSRSWKFSTPTPRAPLPTRPTWPASASPTRVRPTRRSTTAWRFPNWATRRPSGRRCVRTSISARVSSPKWARTSAPSTTWHGDTRTRRSTAPTPNVYFSQGLQSKMGKDIRTTGGCWCPNMQASNDGNNYKVFRYADALLMMAECYFYKENYEKAVEYLDMTRTRANLSKYTFRTPARLEEEIRNERARELFGEFQRKYDLVRWGIWYEAVTDNSDYAYLQLNTANSRIKPCHRYYPIPDTEVTYSKNNLDNNEYKAYGL